MLTPNERIKMIAKAMAGMSQSDWYVIQQVVESEFNFEKEAVTLTTEEELEELLTKECSRRNERWEKSWFKGRRDNINPRVKLGEEPTTPIE